MSVRGECQLHQKPWLTFRTSQITPLIKQESQNSILNNSDSYVIVQIQHISMSVKDVRKHEKSKKPSDVYSQGHEERSNQIISSLSSHIDQLRSQRDRLRINLEDALRSVEYYRQRMNKCTGFNDQFSEEEAKDAEGELQLWQQSSNQIKIKLKAVEDKLREIYGSREKPRKKINYALKKVNKPPSDNKW